MNFRLVDISHQALRVDLLATYKYFCRICPLEFFVFIFRLKNNKKFQQAKATAIRVANESTLNVRASHRLVVLLQIDLIPDAGRHL